MDEIVRDLLLAMEEAIKSALEDADATEEPAEPVTAEEAPRPLTLLTWEDAVRVLRHTCIEAPECGPGCPMYSWCYETNLPPHNSPAYWTEPGAGA